MAAEIKLSDGTDIITDAYSAADVIRMLQGTSYMSFTDASGITYQVNPAQVVYVRDA
jgi:hypothetical protein